jgi:beta-galactosidase
MKYFWSIFAFIFCVSFCRYPKEQIFIPPENSDRDRLFDSEWLFFRGEVSDAEKPEWNDSSWRWIHLPHDWSIEDVPVSEDEEAVGPFSKKSPGKFNTGNFMGGTGWYRKHFRLDKKDESKCISLLFDGVFMNSEVRINGHYLGKKPNGYIPFYYDISDFLNVAGEDNVIAVKVVNTGDNSRWYTGSGIYRHVYLQVTDLLHIPHWGIYVTTPEVSTEKAQIKVVTRMDNSRKTQVTFTLKTQIISPDNKPVTEVSEDYTLPGNTGKENILNLWVDQPQRWSDQTPVLYTVRTELWESGRLIEQVNTPFGIRSIEFSPEKGFLLNGSVSSATYSSKGLGIITVN